MRVELSTGTPAELARPFASEPTMGLVLWPDVGGLRPLYDGHAQRLADEHSWVVCCPELFPGQESLDVGDRLAAAKDLADSAKLADALAAADATGQSRVGVMGFCMGGMYAMKSMATTRFARAVSFYGMSRLPAMWVGGGQSDSLDVLPADRAHDVMQLVGGLDAWCPAEQMDELESIGVHVVRYPDADHAFAQDPSRDSFRADDAADAWRRAIEFLVTAT